MSMEAIDDIITNLTIIYSTPIDWSLSAGPIWLVMMIAALAVGFAIMTVYEINEDFERSS